MGKNCTNKRWFFIMAGVLAMVLATAGFAVSGFKSHFGNHGHGMVKEHMLSKMDYTMQELKLSPEQQNEYAAIRAEMSKEMDAIASRHDVLKETLHTEMAKPEPDIRTIAGTLKTEVRTIPTKVNTQIDAMVAVYDILTPDQQKQLITMVKERMADKGCFSGRD